MNTQLFELIDLVGEDNIFKIVVCNLSPHDMNSVELKQLLLLIKEMKKRRLGKERVFDCNIYTQIENLIEKENMSTISICGATPKKMDKEELFFLKLLIETILLRLKDYPVVVNKWKMKKDKILLSFGYDSEIVNKLKTLQTAMWNKKKKYWEVNISEWPQVEKIFKITQLDIEQKYQEWKEENSVNRLTITNKGCFITGINIPKEEIHLKTSFMDPNAQHIYAYKTGLWDGRIALYDKNTGKFPYGLLNKVLAILKNHHIDYIYEDKRVLPTKEYNWACNVSLRDYQQKVLDKAVLGKNGILQLATGAGKTKTASALVSHFGIRTIFFVHTNFLLKQAKEELTSVLGIDIGQVGDGIIDIKPVTVAMVQTTIRALGGEYTPSEDDKDSEEQLDNTNIEGREDDIVDMLNSSKLIIFDECQFVAADTFYTIANYCPAYYKYGLSATPYRSDKKDLMIEAALGPVIDKINASFLIKRGFLTKPYIYFLTIRGMNSYVDSRKYGAVYREQIIENSYRNKVIVNKAISLAKQNKSVLILVQQVNHGELLKQLFQENSYNVEFVYGIDNPEKRQREVYNLRVKKNLILIASTIADEGLDIPSLDAVFLAGGGKSPSKSMQRVGRSIRVFSLKEQIFEVFNSINEFYSEKKNCVVSVKTFEQMKQLKLFLEQNLRLDILENVEFYDSLDYDKNAFNKSFANSNNSIKIVIEESISIEELNNIKLLDSAIFITDDKFDGSNLVKLRNNISLVNTPESFNDMVDYFKSKPFETKSIVLVEKVGEAKNLKNFLKQENIKSKYITGAKIEYEFEDVMNALQSGKEKNILLINSSFLNEKIPNHLLDRIFVLGMDSTPLKTYTDLLKDFRIFTPKDKAIVLDFYDDCKYLASHSIERMNMFKTEEEFVIIRK